MIFEACRSPAGILNNGWGIMSQRRTHFSVRDEIDASTVQ
jgi:hypothetical protein